VGQLIHFEDRALARLRQRLGAAEEANEDLIAFARGHSGAVSSIHTAVLEAVEAPSIDVLLHVIARRWPAILGIDCAAIALRVGELGFRADSDGIERVEAAFVERMLDGVGAIEVRSVEIGHPLFGRDRSQIRAEALIRIDLAPPLPVGLIAFGQEAELEMDSSHGSELLLFLGRIVAAAVRRFVATA
jgi:uncharacterized protein YigA (DUF484 family)